MCEYKINILLNHISTNNFIQKEEMEIKTLAIAVDSFEMMSNLTDFQYLLEKFRKYEWSGLRSPAANTRFFRFSF